jgi:hypothetical protein
LDGGQVHRLPQLSIRKEEPVPKHGAQQEKRRQGRRIPASGRQQKTKKIKLKIEGCPILKFVEDHRAPRGPSSTRLHIRRTGRHFLFCGRSSKATSCELGKEAIVFNLSSSIDKGTSGTRLQCTHSLGRTSPHGCTHPHGCTRPYAFTYSCGHSGPTCLCTSYTRGAALYVLTFFGHVFY